MKGIVFNLLEEAVTAQYGYAVWEHLLTAAHSDGVYTSLGTYPDDHVQKMVGAAAHALGIPPNDVLRWFGQTAMPMLLTRYPQFAAARPTTRALLLSVNDIIHPEVLKIYPGASVPVFDFRDAPDGGLIMVYRSRRRLCALAQGFTEGAATHFGERIAFTHQTCVHHGDAECVCHIGFMN